MTRKKKKGLRIPNKMRDMADIDYFDKLNPEEKKWMRDFINAEYCNNHRFYKMYTEHPEYNRIKKEIYDRTNAVNTRCDYAKAISGNKLDSFDKYAVDPNMSSILEKLLHQGMEYKKDDDIVVKSGIKSFEDRVNELLTTTISDIRSEYKDPRPILIRFYIKLKRIFADERRQKRLDKELST